MCLDRVHEKIKFKTKVLKCWKVFDSSNIDSLVTLTGLYRDYGFNRGINQATGIYCIQADSGDWYQSGFHCLKYKKDAIVKRNTEIGKKGTGLVLPVYINVEDITVCGVEGLGLFDDKELEVIVSHRITIKIEDYDKAVKARLKFDKERDNVSS